MVKDEVPGVSSVAGARRNGLRGVDHAAAAHGDEKVDAFAAADFDAFAHRVNFGIRGDAGKLEDFESGELRLHGVVEAASLDATAAVGEEHLAAGVLHRGAEFGEAPAAEDEVCRKVEIEILHDGVSMKVVDEHSFT